MMEEVDAVLDEEEQPPRPRFPTCDDCSYSGLDLTVAGTGSLVCRRFPPTVAVAVLPNGGVSVICRHPNIVRGCRGCGEFSPNEGQGL